MNLLLLLAASIAIVGVAAAMTLRNPIHCILSLALGLVGLAGMYLALGAQFVGFTQVLVYVGAVAILAVFALMMTQGGQVRRVEPRKLSATLGGVAACAVAFGVLAFAILASKPVIDAPAQPSTASAQEVGLALMRQYVIPLEVTGLLLTAALIGAVTVALHDGEERP